MWTILHDPRPQQQSLQKESSSFKAYLSQRHLLSRPSSEGRGKAAQRQRRLTTKKTNRQPHPSSSSSSFCVHNCFMHYSDSKSSFQDHLKWHSLSSIRAKSHKDYISPRYKFNVKPRSATDISYFVIFSQNLVFYVKV